MTPESGPPNYHADTIHTPESLQECVVLRNAIDGQVTLWSQMAVTRHPSITHKGMANIIVEDTTPGADMTHEAAAFAQDHRSEEAREKIAIARRLSLVIPIAQDATIDTATPLHTAYVEYFDRINSFRTHPSVPHSYGQAIDALYRIFVTREQLALKTGDASVYDFIDYHTILNRLVDDL